LTKSFIKHTLSRLKKPILRVLPAGNADKEGVLLIMSITTVMVTIDENFSADRALKKFKRQCDSFGIVKEYRKRKEYTKPSIRNKEKSEAAEKRRRKTNSKMRGSSRI
jgi:small subunit ribosomal protein S21